MSEFAPHDVAPNRATYDHLFEMLPGGEFIKPHADDGPWYIVCVTRWEEPNWQLEAVLAAFPGVKAAVYEHGEDFEATFHVVPKFAWRMCQWHSVEFEAQIDTEDTFSAGPYLGAPPTHEQFIAHVHDVQHPDDCRFCAAGEPMTHNYEPPEDHETCSECGSGPCKCSRINQDIDERKGK